MNASATKYPDVKLFIDGAWRNGANDELLAVLDPSTEQEIGKVAVATESDLEDAVGSAVRGFAVWSKTPALERYRLMRKAADNLRERAERIASIMTREQGKPIAEARGEVMAGADIIDWFAEEARRAYGQVVPARQPGVTQMVVRLPVGPVAGFSPWNFPINQVVRKVSAALAAGCSIVVKAPEETPASPAELIGAFIDAGLPPGVINLVFGEPSAISEFLIPHPQMRKISFTGSTAIGKQLAALAGAHMKRVTMELGGHAPVIICRDADVAQAAQVMAAAKYSNAGQVCIAPTRFLVEEPVFDDFLGEFTLAASSIKVGNGLEEGTQMGPLANDRRLPVLDSLVQDAAERGGVVATGGRRIGNLGYFFEPTVLANVPIDARIMNEEPFGPVAVVNPFSSIHDAIEEANRLEYGLASYAFTKSAELADRLGLEIEAGMTSINHYGLALPELFFGGIKDSGYGSEGGSDAIDSYLVNKLVTHKR